MAKTKNTRKSKNIEVTTEGVIEDVQQIEEIVPAVEDGIVSGGGLPIGDEVVAQTEMESSANDTIDPTVDCGFGTEHDEDSVADGNYGNEEAEGPENEPANDEQQDDESEPVENCDSCEKNSDDEFMESITEEQKLTPAQAKAKIKYWESCIEQAQERVEELEPIHQVYKHNGLDPVMEEVKKALRENVEDEKVKEIKDTAKVIEAIHIVDKLIANLNSGYTQNKRDIDRYQGEIEKLGVVQLDIFEKSDDSETSDDAQVEQEATEQNESESENTTPIGPETEPLSTEESELAEEAA